MHLSAPAAGLAKTWLAVTALLAITGCNNPAPAGGPPGQDVGAAISPAAPVIDDKYQARSPRTCTALSNPPTAAQAAVVIQCAMDGRTTSGLFLSQNIQVQMGAPRPFDGYGDAGLVDIDHTASVYPLRGSYTTDLCLPVSAVYPPGHSCMRSDAPEATGACWKTTFGDWKCKLQGATPRMQGGSPAPTTF